MTKIDYAIMNENLEIGRLYFKDSCVYIINQIYEDEVRLEHCKMIKCEENKTPIQIVWVLEKAKKDLKPFEGKIIIENNKIKIEHKVKKIEIGSMYIENNTVFQVRKIRQDERDHNIKYCSINVYEQDCIPFQSERLLNDIVGQMNFGKIKEFKGRIIIEN